MVLGNCSSISSVCPIFRKWVFFCVKTSRVLTNHYGDVIIKDFPFDIQRVITDKPVDSLKRGDMKLVSFDVESNGLHGRGFAIGAIVTDDNGLMAEFAVRCPIEGEVNPWVAEHVLPAITDIPVTHASYGEMLEAFYEFLKHHRAEGDVKILTFIPWPVESNILSDIYRRPGREFEGPFPLIDLATALDTLGYNPTSDEAYLNSHGLSVPFDGVGHNPLYDAYAAEVIYRHSMT